MSCSYVNDSEHASMTVWPNSGMYACECVSAREQATERAFLTMVVCIYVYRIYIIYTSMPLRVVFICIFRAGYRIRFIHAIIIYAANATHVSGVRYKYGVLKLRMVGTPFWRNFGESYHFLRCDWTTLWSECIPILFRGEFVFYLPYLHTSHVQCASNKQLPCYGQIEMRR